MRRIIFILAILTAAALVLAAPSQQDEVVTEETGIRIVGRSGASILADGGTATVLLTSWKAVKGDRDTMQLRYVRELVPRDVFWSAAWDSVDTLWVVPTSADTVVVTLY